MLAVLTQVLLTQVFVDTRRENGRIITNTCLFGELYMPHFRDPVHGFIYVSKEEQKIIDSAPFQRLRNIRQLATTYLVYHGAEHTRFGHSLGVMHLVTRTFNSVVSNTPNLFRENTEENDLVATWYRQILRLIALTHDLGHPPFSHAAEELFAEGIEHEQYTKMIIEETEISSYITEIGRTLHETLANRMNVSTDELIIKYNIRPITPQLVWMIYGEKPKVHDPEYIWPDFVFLKSFMDGELDCDKMDYLLRDARYCGVTYGKYDLDRFISTLTVHTSKDEKVMQLAITSGGIQAFEEFVLARYFMFVQVYFHKSRRHFDRLLILGLKEILPDGKFPDKIMEYLKWDDVRAICEMRCSGGSSSQKFLRRQAMECVYESPVHSNNSEKKLSRILLDNVKSKFPNNEFQYDDVDKKAHKLLPSMYSADDDSGAGVKVIDRHTKEVRNVMDCSLILKGMIDKIFICRIYADGEAVGGIKEYMSKMHAEYSM